MPLQKFPASSSGFTLIELLVTIGILIILIGGSIAGFLRFRDNQQAFAAAKEVQQLMRLAQSKAAANIYPMDASDTSVCDRSANSGKNLQGFRVTNTSGTFKVSPICGSTRTSVNAATAIQTYTVPTGITTTGGTVDFYTLSGGASPARSYTFKVTAGTRTHSFDVTTTGSISDVTKTAD